MSRPRAYKLHLPSEKERLLRELSGYLGPDMECRVAFLNCGTDFKGRNYAIEALDQIRRERVKMMPVKYCDKCDVELLRCEEEFNLDPKDYSMMCPNCDDGVTCPFCELSVSVVEEDGKKYLTCPSNCFKDPLRVRKPKEK